MIWHKRLLIGLWCLTDEHIQMTLIYYLIILLNSKILKILVYKLEVNCKYQVGALILLVLDTDFSLSWFTSVLYEEDILEIKMAELIIFLVDSNDEFYELVQEHQSVFETDDS